jgi:hypothetical protein
MMAGLTVLTILAVSCTSQDTDEGATDDEVTTTTADSGPESAMFGSIESPCGPGDATVAAGDAGAGTDKLYIGVANDRTSTIRPGQLKELWDMGVAFAGWCNAQGGIAGLKVEPVDLDGKMVGVEDAMAVACRDTFAIVGGGWAQDNLMFSGKDGTDFHKCGLIAVPGFAVSTDFNEANGQVQPIPNPTYVQATAWMTMMAKLYPDEVKNLAVVAGNVPSMTKNREQNTAMARETEGFDEISGFAYDAIGNQNWALIAQQVKDSGATAVNFVGETANMARLGQALRDAGFEGVFFATTNVYDPILAETAGPEAVEGTVVRIFAHPYEEADQWPATRQLVDLFEEYGPSDGKLASLSTQSFSAFLLFATVAQACAEEGEITRDCVLREAGSVTEWTAGGLHASGNPAENTPAECGMLIQLRGGTWERLFPEVGGGDDSGDGFYCGDPPLMEITGDFGEGNVDPTRGT